MKIDALHLQAFGPFTGSELDFSRSRRGLHLVYGPNEAGKSSALRALRALLYGIPERSRDGFFHPYARMRIGGTLCAEDGRRLEIIRRKGRTNTLRAADDQTVVDEAELARFLNNVDPDLFFTMFGIGYEDLVAGGREIVSGGGDLGQLVFSAGSGIVRLKEIRDTLQAEAESLFKPYGKNPSINAAISRLREIDKQIQNTMLPGTRWADTNKELRQALEKRKSVETELTENEKARHHLTRIKEALPLIARRREVLDLLGQYENTVLLPDNFAETRRDLVSKLDIYTQEADRARNSIEKIENEIAGLPSTEAVLENAELIEAFHQQLGGQHKASAERIKLETRRTSLLGECREILRSLSNELTLEEAEKLRIKKDQVAAIRRLSSEYEQITTRIQSAREELPGLNEEIELLEEKRRELPAPLDPETLDALKTSLAEASEYGPLEKQNRQSLAELEARKSALENRVQHIGLEGKNAKDLEKLPVPSMETIQLFEDRFDKAGRRLEELSKESKEVSEQIRECETRIKAGQMAQSVPSEADLDEARSRRDRGWEIIRGQLAGNPADEKVIAGYISDAGDASILSEAFEHHLEKADNIADRLRREADRVAENARLAADHEAAGQRKKELDAAHEQAKIDLSGIENQWAGIWEQTCITPATPREMERWVRDLAALKEDLSEFEQTLVREKDLQKAIETRRCSLADRLRALGLEADPEKEPLVRLISRAQKIADNEKDLASRYEKINSELTARKKELKAAHNRLETGEKAFERWRAQWGTAVSPLGLSADAGPAEADAVLEEVRTLFEKLKEAETLRERIKGIDRDAESFAAGIKGLVETVAPDLSGRRPEESALQLQERLTRFREARTRYDTLEKQLADEKKNLESAGRKRAEINSRLERMCEEAVCTDHRQLPEAEQKSRKRKELEAELNSLEERILTLSAGATVEEFVKSAASVDPDAIDPEIGRLDEAIASLSEEKDSLGETIGSLRNEMSKMDGSAKAAELAEQRQEVLGRLDPEARHYARVRIAARILDRAIERFREKNQDPMLHRASELFAAITNGAFKGTRPEFDDNGRPVITGVRGRDDETVYISGMSDGTADQLYLSLRLAGLEMSIEKTSPMPFIVDDILIKFDNDRALAALKTLAELSARTQVIFFTHHYHLIELASQNMPKDTIIYHQL